MLEDSKYHFKADSALPYSQRGVSGPAVTQLRGLCLYAFFRLNPSMNLIAEHIETMLHDAGERCNGLLLCGL